jgi:predicted Rossmann fold nucleotide-binding protein DprA/Smf involved in DNA uptake
MGEDVPLTSTDFAAVFLALTGGPMSAAEIEAETGVSPRVVAEVVRIFGLTGEVACARGRYVARISEVWDGEQRLLGRLNRAPG